MSDWKDENYSEPQGDWGQAAVNDIGWGQSAINAISWGVAHVLSWGHAITNLVGTLFPTDGLEWSSFFPNDFTSASVNSGSGVNMIVVNGDNIAYSDLTGVTVVSQEGTANIQVVGNELQPQNDGNLFSYELSNGIKCILMFSQDNRAYDINSNETGIINGATWLTGRTESEQLYNRGWNRYDVFNVSSAVQTPLLNKVMDITITLTSIGNQDIGIKDDTGSKACFMIQEGSTSASSLNCGSPTYFVNGVNIGNPNRGQLYTAIQNAIITDVVVEVMAQNVDTSIWTGYISIGGYAGFEVEGLLTHVVIDGVDYCTANNWGGSTVIGSFDSSYITGSMQESSIDIFGEDITRPLVGFVDNAPAYSNHYRQIETVVNDTFDTSGDYSLSVLVQVPTGTDGGYSVTNGSMICTVDTVNITFTRDNVTVLTYPHNNTNMMLFTFNSSVTTDVWASDSATEPVKVITGGLAGTATTGVTPLRTNNDPTLSNRLNGYNSLVAGYSRLLTDGEILDVYNFVKGGIPSSTGFPLTFPIILP